MYKNDKLGDWKLEIGDTKDEIGDLPGQKCFPIACGYIKITKLINTIFPSKFY